MSDQNIVTDWKAYFAALGPGKPFSVEELLAMVSPAVEVVVLLDEQPGQLMTRVVLSGEACFDEALEQWEAKGKPRAWLQVGAGTAPWFCDAASLPSRGRVRSKG